MADLKISALTGASTPLAGTEVLPIVQSSTTKKVSIANITAGRDVSMKQLTATADSFIGTDNGGFKYYFGTFTNAAGGANSAYFSPGLTDINEPTNFMFQARDATGELYNVLKVGSNSDVTTMLGNLVIDTSGKGISLPGGITWTSGAGSPEGVVTAPIGSIYSRSDGGILTSFYVKQSGTGNTGWAAK